MRTSVAHLVGGRLWAVNRLSPAHAELQRLAGGAEVEIDLEAFEARAKSAASMLDRLGAVRQGNVEIIPVYNVITQRFSWLTWLMVGTALDWLLAAITEAVLDPEITAIVLDIDSPGGSVDGLIEFAADFRKLAEQKPIIPVANTMSASAAVWLSAGGNEYICTPSGSVGSIGVYAMHVDMSRALDMDGLTVTYIHYGEYKVEGNPYNPLTDEALAQIQSEVDYSGRKFEADVAKGRNVTASVVHEQFGQGRMLLPEQAIAAGLVDRIDTLANTVKRYQRGAAAIGRRAEGTTTERVAEGSAPELGESGQQGDGPAADDTDTSAGAPESATDDTASASAVDNATAANVEGTTPTPDPTPVSTQRDVARRKAARVAAFDRAVRGEDPRPWFERSQQP